MILSEDEYKKGFIDFDANLPIGTSVEVWTRTAEHPQEDTAWEGPYTQPTGSKVHSSLNDLMQLSIGLHTSDPHLTPVLKKVRWERDGLTSIWPGSSGFNGPPRLLTLGRDYGVSYLLILKPKRANGKDLILSRSLSIK